MEESCVFCGIVRGAVQSYVLAETEHLIVFLSKENHPLIVPKAHVQNLYTLDDALAAEILPLAKRVARALKAALECEGIYLTQANEAAAGQDVFHFHLHVYPRWHQLPLEAQQTSAGVSAHDRRLLLDRLHAVWEA